LRPRPAAAKLNWPMRYEISGARVLTWALETHLVDHCNLRCQHCCTLSPQRPPRFVRVQDLARDLAQAASVLKPSLFKLTGGEPLLHPALVECLHAVRRSGISEQVSLTSNGLLLPQAPDAVFRLLDRLTVSVYASAPLPEAVLARVAERCQTHGVLLTVKRIDRFQQMDPPAPHAIREARRVFANCWLRNRCHLIRDGRFYTCTRPPHLGAHLGLPSLPEADGVVLAGPDPLRRLLASLESEQPLDSCRHCLGASGPWQAHRQVPADGHGAAAVS